MESEDQEYQKWLSSKFSEEMSLNKDSFFGTSDTIETSYDWESVNSSENYDTFDTFDHGDGVHIPNDKGIIKYTKSFMLKMKQQCNTIDNETKKHLMELALYMKPHSPKTSYDDEDPNVTNGDLWDIPTSRTDQLSLSLWSAVEAKTNDASYEEEKLRIQREIEEQERKEQQLIGLDLTDPLAILQDQDDDNETVMDTTREEKTSSILNRDETRSRFRPSPTVTDFPHPAPPTEPVEGSDSIDVSQIEQELLPEARVQQSAPVSDRVTAFFAAQNQYQRNPMMNPYIPMDVPPNQFGDMNNMPQNVYPDMSQGYPRFFIDHRGVPVNPQGYPMNGMNPMEMQHFAYMQQMNAMNPMGMMNPMNPMNPVNPNNPVNPSNPMSSPQPYQGTTSPAPNEPNANPSRPRRLIPAQMLKQQGATLHELQKQKRHDEGSGVPVRDQSAYGFEPQKISPQVLFQTYMNQMPEGAYVNDKLENALDSSELEKQYQQ